VTEVSPLSSHDHFNHWSIPPPHDLRRWHGMSAAEDAADLSERAQIHTPPMQPSQSTHTHTHTHGQSILPGQRQSGTGTQHERLDALAVCSTQQYAFAVFLLARLLGWQLRGRGARGAGERALSVCAGCAPLRYACIEAVSVRAANRLFSRRSSVGAARR